MTLSFKGTLYDHFSYHIDKKIMSSQRQCLRFLLWEFSCTCPNQGRNGLSVEEGLGSLCSIPQLYSDSLCGNSLAENWQQTLSCYQHHEDSLSKHTRCKDFIISWNISNFHFFSFTTIKRTDQFSIHLDSLFVVHNLQTFYYIAFLLAKGSQLFPYFLSVWKDNWETTLNLESGTSLCTTQR